jgi:lambda family phage tail tape measure protein
MSNFSFQIVADPGSALRVIGNVQAGLVRVEVQARRTGVVIGDAMDASARRAAATANSLGRVESSLGRMMAVAGTLQIGRSLVRFSDGYTQISNRLNTVATDQANLNGLMKASHGIAQDTMTDWVLTAEAVVRFSNATKELGVSQRDVLKFTTSLNKAIILSGAATSESKNGLIQLSQGLASGALRGDELRSVLENLPTVADVIAKGMGKTRGELRKLGAQGKITAREVYDAFVKAAPDIEARFGKVVPTIAQSMTRLRNEAIKFFGETGRSSGLIRGLGEAFAFVVRHFETFGKVLLGVGQALLALYVIEKIIVLLRTLAALLIANPLGALLVVLTVGIALLRQFGDQIETTNTVMTATGSVVVTVGDYLRALWDIIKMGASAIYDFIEGAWTSLTDAFSDGIDSAGIELSLRNVLIFMASFVDAAIAIFGAMKQTLVGVFGGLTAGVGEMFVDLARGVVSIVQEMVNKIIDAYNFVDEKINGASRRKARGDANVRAIREEREALLRFADAGGDPSALGFKPIVLNGQPLSGAALLRYHASSSGITSDLGSGISSRAARRRTLGLDAEDLGSGGGISHVDLSFVNPLKGATDHARDMIGDAWGKDFGSSTARDFVTGFLDALDEAARQKAVERAAAAAAVKPGTISDAAGRASPLRATAEQERQARKLANELEAIERASNPATAAQMKLADAVDVTTRALAAGLIKSAGEADRIVSDLAKTTADARDPMLAWQRSMDQEHASLLLTNGERDRANRIREEENKLRERGVEIDAAARATIATSVDRERGAAAVAASQERELQGLQQVLDEIRGPMDAYAQRVSQLERLQTDGAITTAQFRTEMRKAREEYERSFEGQDPWRDGLDALIKQATDVAGAIEAAFTNTFKSIEDGLVELATKGTFSWHKMVESMLSDLTRLLFRQALAGIGRAAGLPIPAFATGGSFMVGGRGGTDSQVVAFRASPNERVTVQNPSQTRQDARRAGGGGGAGMSVRVVNVNDPNQPIARMDSPDGERLILNTVVQNMDMIRTHVLRK